jgi:hypothetical protein
LLKPGLVKQSSNVVEETDLRVREMGEVALRVEFGREASEIRERAHEI